MPAPRRRSGALPDAFSAPSRRRPQLSLHVGGVALVFLAIGILVSAAVEAGAGGSHAGALLASGLAVGGVGAVLWRVTAVPERVSTGATLVAVTATWGMASVAGAMPFLATGTFTAVDLALFESVSGFTGTGATVLAPIEDAPRGALFWRSLTQWYGGTGIIVLAVAILPFLGVGGMDLLRAEAPGPTTDRLAPRVSETAKRLWLIYGVATVAAVAVLLVVGLSVFDATTHAFTLLSTGGLSPYDASVAQFDSVVVELVFVFFMLFAAVNFALHYRAFTRGPGQYAASAMFRYYAAVFAVFTAAVAVLLWWQGDHGLGEALRHSVFNVTTLLTSTGFATADFAAWVPAAQLLLLLLMVSGGMAGSTSGGMTLIRARVLGQHALREIRRIRAPRAVLPIRLGDETVEERIVQRVVGFTLLYFLFIGLGAMLLAFLGSGLVEAAGAATSAMGNMGPALGEAGPSGTYLYFSGPERAVLMALMLAGRLEIFPVLFVVTAIAQRTGQARRGSLHRLRRSYRDRTRR